MANVAALRSSLVWLAAFIALVGLSTHSFRKMLATYVLGVLGIAGVLLPDWEYFDRDFSRWTSPVSAEERAPSSADMSLLKRFTKNPLRLGLYATVYGLALYKWWIFVSS
ncbi:hypothetical protein MLD38_001446 [Melastoma candidum]|uniref:Uncharacterized protein n=1 Tax=Melastoma candidum TaxID=119954 RepID=A0ACB9SH77_9MYRT|nr:hypothetical protein MLD38_001446 [Melastoma candidum]